MKTKTRQTIEVSTEYRHYREINIEETELLEKIGAKRGESHHYELKGIRITAIRQSRCRWDDTSRISKVKVYFQSPDSYRDIRRVINVNDGVLDVSAVLKKVDELAKLKGIEEEKAAANRQKKDDEEAYLESCRDQGLRMNWNEVICKWDLSHSGAKTFAISRTMSMTLEQALQVQRLIESFRDEANG
jgi:hypothetical protein